MTVRKTLGTAMLAVCMLASILPAKLEGAAGKGNGLNRSMLVTTRWLAVRMQSADFVVLHIARDDDGYREGHIPGARFLSWAEVATTRNGIPNELPALPSLVQSLRNLGVNNTSRIVLYDEGAGLQAARAFVALDYLGLGEQTSLLDGHLKKWKAEGKPLATGPDKPRSGNLTVVPQPERIVDRFAVQDYSWAASQPGASLTLIDSRPWAQYTGEDPGKGVERGGHIPNARNVYWLDHVESAEMPVLKGLSQIQALYRPTGIQPDHTVVVYCRTGGQASHTYFLMRYLGYDVRLYDASFIEWSRYPEHPVVSGPSPN